MKVRLLTCFLLLLTAAVSAQTFPRNDPRNRDRRHGSRGLGGAIAVHNANTGLERVTLTSADGSYSVP